MIRKILVHGVLILAVWGVGCNRKPSLQFQGYVEGEFVQVATSEAGRLDRLTVAKGDRVETGALLFALDAVPEAAALRQAREQLATAEAQLRDILTGKRPQELEVITAQLDQARAEAKKSVADRERDQAQFGSGGISKAQLDKSQAAADATSARVAELERQYEVARLPARDDQILAQQAQVAAARAAVEQAEWRLGQKTVMAPVAGRIFDTLYETGEWVAAGRPVVRLLSPDKVKIRFFVPETALGGLTVGQALRVHCDGSPDEISAEITYISTEAEYTPPVIYSNETRSKLVFMVEARPLNGANLHPGQPVAVGLRGNDHER